MTFKNIFFALAILTVSSAIPMQEVKESIPEKLAEKKLRAYKGVFPHQIRGMAYPFLIVKKLAAGVKRERVIELRRQRGFLKGPVGKAAKIFFEELVRLDLSTIGMRVRSVKKEIALGETQLLKWQGDCLQRHTIAGHIQTIKQMPTESRRKEWVISSNRKMSAARKCAAPLSAEKNYSFEVEDALQGTDEDRDYDKRVLLYRQKQVVGKFAVPVDFKGTLDIQMCPQGKELVIRDGDKLIIYPVVPKIPDVPS